MDQKTGTLGPYHGVDESEASRPALRRPVVARFPEIFQQHSPFLWRALMNLGVPSHEAQDLCQEVMLIVHRRLSDFDGQSLRAWLYGICVRVAADYRKSARVRREIPHADLPDAGLPPEQAEQLERSRRVEQVLDALEALNEDQRAAFVLYEVEELTLAEISEALGAPLQTVYSRIKTARETLRRELSTNSNVAQGGKREAG